MRFGVRYCAPPESISKRAPSTTRTSLPFKISRLQPRSGAVSDDCDTSSNLPASTYGPSQYSRRYRRAKLPAISRSFARKADLRDLTRRELREAIRPTTLSQAADWLSGSTSRNGQTSMNFHTGTGTSQKGRPTDRRQDHDRGRHEHHALVNLEPPAVDPPGGQEGHAERHIAQGSKQATLPDPIRALAGVNPVSCCGV